VSAWQASSESIIPPSLQRNGNIVWNNSKKQQFNIGGKYMRRKIETTKAVLAFMVFLVSASAMDSEHYIAVAVVSIASLIYTYICASRVEKYGKS
jgi:hypothetical protein